jgi:phosphoheptose isomerase
MVVKEVKDRIRNIFQESVRTKERFLENNLDVLVEVIQTLGTVINGGNKILLFGNGGSAGDAQHLAAEFVNRYLIDRPPLAALALTTDTSVLTAIANDFDWGSARQAAHPTWSRDWRLRGISAWSPSESADRGMLPCTGCAAII